MFGLGKKKEEKSSASVDRLDALKKQLAELKSKEAELDAKKTQPAPAVEQQNVPVQEQAKEQIPVASETVSTEPSEPQPKIVPSELNDEPAMVVRSSDSYSHYVGSVDGVVLEIGAGMSLNLPIRPRMKIDEFIAIAERVKALSALNFEHK